MATPFSRTLRSLELDRTNNYMAQIGLLATIFFAFLWGYWFLTAPMLAYEVSHEISVTPEEDTVVRLPQNSVGAVRPQSLQRRTILAKFPSKVIENIQPGQSAWLRLEGKGQQRGAIPVEVAEIMASSNPKTGLVKLYTMIDSTNSYPFTGDERGEITIEHHRGVPAHFVFRASGLLIETPPVSVSPSPRYLP
jgi:hypothetical protein